MSTDYIRIFRALPYTSVIFGTDYCIVEATDDYLRMTERKREDLLGKNVFEAFPDNPNDTSSNNTGVLKKSIDKAIATKKEDVMDLLRYDIPKPEGGFYTRYWDASHTPVLDDRGEVIYVIQKTVDATERILTQQALEDSQERAAFIAESMPQLIWMSDKDGEVLYLNHRWEDYSGLKNEELQKDVWNNLVHPDDIEAARNAWERALKDKDSYQVQTRIKNKDGRYRWHLSRALPKMDKDGNVKFWVGSATDIHDTKTTVDELLKSNEYMSELSDKLQDAYRKTEGERKTLEKFLMEAPAMVCILKGADHVFELANPIYEQSVPGRQLIGKPCAEAIPEAVEQGFIDMLDKVYQKGETIVGRELLLPLYRKGTNEPENAYFTFTYQPLYEDNKITGVMVFAMEVTDTVLLKQKLAEVEKQ